MAEQTLAASENVSVLLTLSSTELTVSLRGCWPSTRPLTAFLAFGTHREIGAAVLPFARHEEGSTVFLPFKCDLLVAVAVEVEGVRISVRRWENWNWNDRAPDADVVARREGDAVAVHISRALLGDGETVDFASYIKDHAACDGWGWFFGCCDRTVRQGAGDKYIRHYYELQLDESGGVASPRRRLSTNGSKMRIYQLFVRLFGNTNERRKQNGTLAENGVGKFNDINDAALTAIRSLGCTHIWLTGVLQQATGTDYSAVGRPADDPDLLKGIAGSPYAIKDYFDVCPDYAIQPQHRLDEFRALVDRIHRNGLKVLIDFVPNHVARSYSSGIHPELDFGRDDDRAKFFDAQNNFYYLQLGEGPPLRLPTWKHGQPVSATCKLQGMNCDGLYDGERTFGRVTGNNSPTWSPSLNDWYETVKLNYGFDFTDAHKQTCHYPHATAPQTALPDTWLKMDGILAYWQAMGIDGFRCDMAHLVPPEFWNWLIDRARRRDRVVIFVGEAYDNDPAKVPCRDHMICQLGGGYGNVKYDLLNAGFDAVYDDPTYRALEYIYERGGWANDIDGALSDEFIRDNSLRYAENHDEVRLAARSCWGGFGMEVGRPVCAILYGLSRGALLVHNGQEVGERAEGAEGFGGDDARTSIFDYWSMPELVKWVNDHKYDGGGLSTEQRELRDFYARLLKLVGEPAFADGDLFLLNRLNHNNRQFGRLAGEQVSGHWLYAFLRYDRQSEQRFLIVANLHPSASFDEVVVIVGENGLKFLGLGTIRHDMALTYSDRLARDASLVREEQISQVAQHGLAVGAIAPLSACYFEIVAPVAPSASQVTSAA